MATVDILWNLIFPVRQGEEGRSSCLITNKNLPGVSTQGADVAEVTEPK